MRALGKFNLKINVIPNGLKSIGALVYELYNKLSFFDNFQFLSSSLDGLVKNLNKDAFLSIKVKNLIRTIRSN